jgi:hypothetical protein
MGLFDYIFKFRPKVIGTYQGKYQLLEGYSPHFRRWGGELYESELVRAAINARATHISKLDVAIQGSARPALQRKLKAGPNSFQTWSQFLYRLSTILDVHNTAFICPVYDEFGEPSGIYTPLPNKCEIVQYNDVPYLRYEFHYGQHAAIELEYCGIMTKMQYKNDFFGETNHALFPTMELINTQNQGIEEGVKSAASYKFMARLNNFQKTEDIAKERKRFTEENLKSEETYQFMQESFDEEGVITTGLGITKIMPPMPLFGGGKGRAEKKKKVIALLEAFFNKYFNLIEDNSIV